MARVVFTPNLERHLHCPPASAAGTTVREVLEDVFSHNPRLRGYVLDDQGALRRHMAIFVRGEVVADRERLSDPVGADDEVFVVQALSGGSS